MEFRSATAWAGLLALLMMFAAAQVTASYPELVQRAFDNMDQARDQGWSFTQTTTEKKQVRVERCRYHQDACQWQLVSINGKPPTVKQRKRYAKDKPGDGNDENGHPDRGDNRFEKLAEPGSIRLLHEDAIQAVYQFRPLAENEEDKKINEQLQGRLVINKQGPFVKSFEMQNTGPIPVAPLVKLHSMHIAMEFSAVAEGGPYLPAQMHTRIFGKIGGLKKISQDKRVQFSDYRRVDETL